MPRFDDIRLDEQLTMPDAWKRELLARPATHRGPDATDNNGAACTKYYRRHNPTKNTWEWNRIPGADCSRGAIEGPPSPAPKPTPPPAPAPAPAPPRIVTQRVCGTATYLLSLTARWDANQAGNTAFVNRWGAEWRTATNGLYRLCPDQIELVNREIDRLVQAFGGSRTLVPIQVRVPVQALAATLRTTANAYNPKTIAEQEQLQRGGEVIAGALYQRIRLA